ncbi:YihY/virulence factor BrkB family protein [Anaerolineae bacterium CFX9]|jgi:membrane protein|nr:YihY/virulence factor BrkB family protein [Anaerolineae bacterium CFX9]
MNLREIGSLIAETFREWQADKASRLAAALSYFTLFSVAPLLVLVIRLAGQVFSSQVVEERIVRQVGSLAGDGVAQTLSEMIRATETTGSGLLPTIIGVIVLVFGATGVFVQLEDSLNTIWKAQPQVRNGIIGLIRSRVLSFSVVLGIGFLLLVSLAVNALLAGLTVYLGEMFALPEVGVVILILNGLLSLVVITALFAVIYKYLPAVRITWRDVGVGAFVTALLFLLGQFAIGAYLGHSDIASAYGAAGSLVVILVWVFYSAQIFLLGAEFTKVFAYRYGSKPVVENPLTPEAIAIEASPEAAQPGV